MDDWSKKVGDKLKGFNYDKPLEENKVQLFFDNREFARTGKKISITGWMVWAACVSVLVMSGVIVYLMNDVSYETQSGQLVDIELPDGSKVELGYGSEISFNSLTWRWNRNVSLEGEGYFEVETGSTFSVISTIGITSVLGTKFNVKTVEGSYAVECFEGKVKVETEGQSTELTKGMAVRVRSENEITSYTVATDKPEWLTGELSFENASIQFVLSELARVYGIQFADKSVLTSQVYNGYFPTDDVDLALKLVFDPLDISYELRGKVVGFK